MARVNPTDPLESIDIKDRTLDRTKIGKVRQTVFNLGEDYEDPRVQFKYYRNMAARYGSGFIIARRQSGNLWSWGCSGEEPIHTLLDHDAGSGTATYGQLYIGQSFTPDEDWVINQIYVNYAWVTGGATHCKLTIRQDSGGDPGAIVATADLLAISDTSAPGGEYTFTFSTPPQLTSGNMYWAVFQASDSGGNPSGFFFWYYYGADTLDGGYLTYSTDGATWNPSTTYDIRRMKIIGSSSLTGYPQFGLGTTNPTSVPQMINAGDIDFSRVFATGKRHTIALDVSGAPWAWGDNLYGQLTSAASSGGASTPTATIAPTATGPIYGLAVAAGWGHSLVVDQDDTKLWAWGLNRYGQLGDGTTDNKNTPTQIGLGGGRRFRKIDAGDEHTIALDQRGQVWTWGNNAFGQLGDGSTTDNIYPTLPQEIPQPDVIYNWRDGIYSESLDVTGKIITNIVGINACGWATGGFPFTDGYEEVPWEQPLVVSVEYFELTLTASDTVVTDTVTKGQNLNNCVPFMSGIIQNQTGSTLFNRHFVKVSFGGTNQVRASRGASGDSVTVGFFVVEFNPDRVKVQHGDIDTGRLNELTPIDSVNLSKTFLYFSWKIEGGANNWGESMVRGKFEDASTLRFDRWNKQTDFDLDFWVVESLDEYGFIVEHREWQHETSYISIPSPPSPLSTANGDKMLNLFSWNCNQGNTNATSQIHCYFEPSDYSFKSIAGGSVSGRICQVVGQAITFLDGTKSLNKWSPQYPTRKLDWTTNLTDFLTNVFPGRNSGYEDYYAVNGNYAAIIQNNPQGMSRQQAGNLDSMQVICRWGSGDPPGWAYAPSAAPDNSWVDAERGNNAGTLGWSFYDVISFDNLDTADAGFIYRTPPWKTPETKSRTFGALDGENSYDFNNGNPLSDVWIQNQFNWGSGNFDFSYKCVFRTPPTGIGPATQMLFWYGDQFSTRGQILVQYTRDTRDLYAGHVGDVENLGTLNAETWYTLYVTYDSATNTEKYFLDGEFVTQRILGGSMVIAPSTTTMAIMNHGWLGDNQFYGRMDNLTLWKSDISEGQLLLGEAGVIETRFIEIAAGSQSSYGIDVEGIAWAWGDNTYGQLGDGTATNKSAPVSVAGRHSFIHITGGGAVSEGHACALKPDGSVWCWGRNDSGQLGLCDYTDRSSPESVVGNHSFIDVWAAKDGYNTIAIKADGSVWVWGKSPFCDGVDYCSPVSVPDFNLITLNILGRGYLEDHSLLLEF